MNTELFNRVNALINRVSFQNYQFRVNYKDEGVTVQGVYEDKDVYTKKLEPQFTREWFIESTRTDSQIMGTIFKLCLTSMEHRCREEFLYRGKRIYGPHFDINDLVALCKDRENAGGPE